MRYQKFIISNYKAVSNATLDLTSEGLVLLLGINESGKTSVLRSIESFDHTNDVANEPGRTRFYKSIRNKKEINSTASISAEIVIENANKQRILEMITPHITDTAINQLKQINVIKITRFFQYQNAEFTGEHYSLGSEIKSLLKPEVDQAIESNICKEILTICPSIQYFEDFKDQIPDFISLTTGTQWYNADWASTIEGLFYHADPEVTVEQFQSLSDSNARQSTLNKVNLALNKQFTNRWNKKLKGAKSIHKVDLVYDPTTRQFTFQITGSDKTTVFAIDERSKGALWYFTFLLKTEFRKRKLRADLGKTLYLIDEPGSNLHSTAQINMVTDFRTLASDSNVIYTTHSQYLIDKENLSNVYIVDYANSRIRVTKYQDYLRNKKMKTSYYQPIIDALEIQPFSFNIIWDKVLIVEGVYDYCGFKFMFEKILRKKCNFSILPCTGATGHETLISLHIGWSAKCFVLLDNDAEGRASKDIYLRKFPTLNGNIEVLNSKSKPSGDIEFENLFLQTEREALSDLAGFGKTKVTKKIFQQTLANILYKPSLTQKASSIIGKQTKDSFDAIFNLISVALT